MRHFYLVLFLTMVSCSTTVKRYKRIESSKPDNTTLVSVDLFGTKVEAAKEEDKTKSLWDLQAEGQQELIKQLATRNTENEKFTAALDTKYLKGKEKLVTDYTTKDIKLIFSISKKRDYTNIKDTTKFFSLADRIEYVQFDVNITKATNLNFIKWNKFSTEYTTVDVADVTFSKTLSATASSGASNSSGTENTSDPTNKITSTTGVTPSVSSTGTISQTEVQKVRFRYVTLNGKLDDKQISIEQEGMREIDLAGNVAAEINLKFDETPETLTSAEGFKTETGYNLPDKIKIAQYTAMVPVVNGLPNTIDATLNYTYTYRHVKSGEKTFYEWDDCIEYLNGSATKTIVLFKKKDYLPSFYNISKIGEDGLAANQRTRIMLKDMTSNDTTEMIFPSLSAAQEFFNWLVKFTPASGTVNSPIKIGPYQLILKTPGTETDLTKQLFITSLSSMQVLTYYR